MNIKVLFITFSKRGRDRYSGDPSVVYRCFNMANEIIHQGGSANVVHAEHSVPSFKPDVVVFHRPIYGKVLKQWLSKYKKSLLIADYDDLLVDEALIEDHPSVLSKVMSRHALKQEIKKYVRAIELFNNISVSTKFLKSSISKIFPDKHIIEVKNFLSENWCAYGSQFKIDKDKFKPKIISYFSGTANHQKDFNLISRQLDEFSSSHNNVFVWVFGDIDIPSHVNSGRWKHFEKVDYYALTKYLQKTWISIAPLINNKFNACKSDIKILESGIFCVPVLCSNVPEYQNFRSKGVEVLSPDDYSDVLDRNLSPSYYQNQSVILRKNVRDQCLERRKLAGFWQLLETSNG